MRPFATFIACLVASLTASLTFAAEAPRDASAAAPPKLTLAFELHALVDNPVVIGQGRAGLRRIVAITGGTVRGPMLNGVVVPNSGADWQLIQPDGFSELDTRYTLRSDKGELVYVQNAGIRHAAPDVMKRLNAGETVDPKLVYFRTVAKFETTAPGLQALTRSIFIGVGERSPNEVIVRFYRVD